MKIIKLAGIFFYCKRRISQCFIFPFFKIEKKYIKVKLKLTSAVAFDTFGLCVRSEFFFLAYIVYFIKDETAMYQREFDSYCS